MTGVRKFILAIIDFFYPPFRRLIPQQTFRYLACGGGNTFLDIALYYVSFHYILHEKNVSFGFFEISPHIMAFLMAFSVCFPLGFALSKYVVFSESELRGRIQLFRYALLVGMCLLLNYLFLKLFVEELYMYPTVSKIITTLIVAVFSYIAQRNFTFKIAKVPAAESGKALR